MSLGIRKRNRTGEGAVDLDVAVASAGRSAVLAPAPKVAPPADAGSSKSVVSAVPAEMVEKRSQAVIVEAPKLPADFEAAVRTKEGADTDRTVCKDFFETGYCALGDACHYAHFREGSQRVPTKPSNWSKMRERLTRGGTQLKPTDGGAAKLSVPTASALREAAGDSASEDDDDDGSVDDTSSDESASQASASRADGKVALEGAEGCVDGEAADAAIVEEEVE